MKICVDTAKRIWLVRAFCLFLVGITIALPENYESKEFR